MMSGKELRRVHVIRQTMEKKLTQAKAGELVGLTARMCGALCSESDRRGTRAGTSGTGKAVEPADRGAAQGQGAEAVRAAVWRFWADVGGGEAGRAPWHHAQRRDPAAWLRERGSSISPGGRARTGVAGAEAHRGELIQLDGSHHDWFEAGAPLRADGVHRRCEQSVFARFYEYEGTIRRWTVSSDT